MVLILRRALRWLGIGGAAFLVGLSIAALAGQQFPGPGTVIHVICDSGCGGGGGGGGTTIADGADVAEGTTTDPLWTVGSASGTVIALLKTIATGVVPFPYPTTSSSSVLLTTSFVSGSLVDVHVQGFVVINVTDQVGHFTLTDGFNTPYFTSTPIAPRSYVLLPLYGAVLKNGFKVKADEASTLRYVFTGDPA